MSGNLITMTMIVGGMSLLSMIEVIVPLHRDNRWNRLHRVPNLSLTLITFATNAVFNSILIVALIDLDRSGVGLLPWLGVSPWVAAAMAIVGLDFSFYVAHVAMHKVPALWRVHRVHHSDPAVDVTTTIRQHPLEGVIRYAFMSAAAIVLGAGPIAFAIYRAWSALHGLVEHANIRMPQRIDSALTWVVSSPNMHKIHHSRLAAQTDTNYGNLFVFDRLFGTFTPSAIGVEVECGLEGFDDVHTQSVAGLMALPFRDDPRKLHNFDACRA